MITIHHSTFLLSDDCFYVTPSIFALSSVLFHSSQMYLLLVSVRRSYYNSAFNRNRASLPAQSAVSFFSVHFFCSLVLLPICICRTLFALYSLLTVIHLPSTSRPLSRSTYPSITAIKCSCLLSKTAGPSGTAKGHQQPYFRTLASFCNNITHSSRSSPSNAIASTWLLVASPVSLLLRTTIVSNVAKAGRGRVI